MAVLSTLLSKGLGTVVTQVNMINMVNIVNMVQLDVDVVNTDMVYNCMLNGGS